MHCSVLGREALEAAIADYKGYTISEKGLERIVCKCFGTTEAKIRQIIQENNVSDIQGVTNYCKAGGGCGKCHDDIQKIIDDELNNRAVKQPKKAPNKDSDDYKGQQCARKLYC